MADLPDMADLSIGGSPAVFFTPKPASPSEFEYEPGPSEYPTSLTRARSPVVFGYDLNVFRQSLQYDSDSSDTSTSTSQRSSRLVFRSESNVSSQFVTPGGSPSTRRAASRPGSSSSDFHPLQTPLRDNGFKFRFLSNMTPQPTPQSTPQASRVSSPLPNYNKASFASPWLSIQSTVGTPTSSSADLCMATPSSSSRLSRPTPTPLNIIVEPSSPITAVPVFELPALEPAASGPLGSSEFPLPSFPSFPTFPTSRSAPLAQVTRELYAAPVATCPSALVAAQPGAVELRTIPAEPHRPGPGPYNPQDETAPECAFFSPAIQSALRNASRIAKDTIAAIGKINTGRDPDPNLQQLLVEARGLQSFQGNNPRTIAVLGETGRGMILLYFLFIYLLCSRKSAAY
jgi:hypothetical protein